MPRGTSMTYQAGETSAENVLDLRRYSVDENRRIQLGFEDLENAVLPRAVMGIAGLGLPMQFSSSIVDGDPGAGFFRLNNAAMASVSQIFISKVSPLGGDLGPALMYIGDDDEVQFVNRDTFNHMMFRTNGVTLDAGSYAKIPVIPSPLITGVPANNDVVDIRIYATRI